MEEQFKKERTKSIGKVAVIGVAVVLLILFVLSFTYVKAGYVGILYSPNGGVINNKVVTQGMSLQNPFYKVKKYTVGTEQACLSKDKREGSDEDESFSIPTSDGKTVSVDLEF